MAETTKAFEEAEELFYWYVNAAKASRLRFQLSEVGLLLVAASVPIAGILTPGDSRLASILGAVVVALTGLRSVFHWRENYSRYSVACAKIKSEMRLYLAGSTPYDGASTRDQALIAGLNDIEQAETTAWTSLAGPGSPPSPMSSS